MSRKLQFAVAVNLLAINSCLAQPTFRPYSESIPSQLNLTTSPGLNSLNTERTPAVVNHPDHTLANTPLENAASNPIHNPFQARTLDLTIAPADIWQRIRNGFAIPNLNTPLAAERTSWYAAKPEAIRRMAERAGRYLFHIVEECEKRGLPTELALLPFVESAFNPIAYSSAKASGIWQFIPSTGKNYGLEQNWWLDERRDILASTDAALNYLAFLFDMHGDWYLALASYNWGEGAVKRAIEKNKAKGLPTDYESLSMPNETRYYVPKLQAIKNIVANPALYGVSLPAVSNEPYFTAVNTKTSMDMRTAAKLAGLSVEEFRQLNPAYNRSIIPGTAAPPLLVPTERALEFVEGIKSSGDTTTWRTYRLAKGEKIDHVAARFGTSAQMLRQVNGLGIKSRSFAGMTILVPGAGKLDSTRFNLAFETPSAQRGNSNTGLQKYRNHTVKSGETLASIARTYDTSTDNLRRINALKTNTVKPGQKLLVNEYLTYSPTRNKQGSAKKTAGQKATTTSSRISKKSSSKQPRRSHQRQR